MCPPSIQLSRDISGNVGLLFTDLETDDVEARLEHFVEEDFARSGDRATETFKLDGGKLPSMQVGLGLVRSCEQSASKVREPCPV